nr:putative retrotransposon protein [Tanacetum cinerariifolium]
MHNMGKTVNELHAMLNLHEQTLPKNNAPALHAIRAGKVQKGNKHKKSQSQMAARGQNHGKRKISKLMLPSPRFPLHLRGKIPQRTQSVMSVGLRASKKLKPGALSLYVGNGQREAVEAIDVFHLCLPSGLEIVLNICHYAPSITRGVISVSRLYEDGFVNRFVNNTIQVSKNNMVYYSAIPRDGIFEIDLSNSHTNESSIYADHGIIAHRTPPYTPQHNGVSERRNKTLLDMVRSMMSQTTLPKSFWDYALEIAARILNMIPTKKLNAMNVEMQSIKDNKVWVLVGIHPNGKTVGSNWLFKKKPDLDRNVHTYKARLVAMGYTQTPWIDYEETFSPVADIRAIRILIATAAYYGYEIWQMDVKTAVLNGYLNEEVYMKQPEGFVNPKYPNRVFTLKRSTYGLKQASRQWNKRFDDEIKKFGFTQNHDEPCVYLKASGSNITFLILYVDDILIMGNNIPMLQSVKSHLGRCFAMKDLGEA